MITIVDTGGANLASVINAFSRLGLEARLTSDPDVIFSGSHVLLPGVGAAKDSMDRIRRAELTQCLRELRQPTLGICLGMQLLFAESEEGEVDCLGVIPGRVARIPERAGLPVPHMGWNRLVGRRADLPLFRGIAEESYFYFVHCFAAPAGEWVGASFRYGTEYPAVIHRDNYFGVQFHPEKSAGPGRAMLRNFVTL